MKKQTRGEYVAGWKTTLDWVLRAIILASGIYQTLFAETTIGVLTLIALSIITLPTFFSRGRIKAVPIEIEILLFFMVMLQLVIGEARDFYSEVPYYDKFVHYLIPMFMGLIGFLILYTLYFTGNLLVSTKAMIIVVILASLGLGAAWEILEYASDEILYPRIEGWHKFQGSLTEDPLHDTMNDLIADSLGAIAGATLSAWVIGKRQKKGDKRLPELLSEVAKIK